MSWLDAASADGDSYLADTVRLLWPAPARLSTTRRATETNGQLRSYLVVPSARRPKVLIPARPRRAADAAIRGFKSTQDHREAWLLAACATGLRLGGGAVLRDRLYVSVPRQGAAEDLESHLAATLHHPVHLSLHVSRPRAVRKPVLQLIDDAGCTFAFAKVGIDPFTSALVRGESRTVARLAPVRWRVLRVPRLLHAGTWHGHPLIVQQALPRSGGGHDERIVGAAMDELARIDGTETVTLSASPFWTRLLERARRLPPSPVREVIIASLAELARSSGAARVEFGAWHGDWTPWNMNVRGGRVQVWDWEKFDVGVPVGFDAAHCFVQRAVVWDARPPADAFAQLIDRGEPMRTAHRLTVPAAQLAGWMYTLTLAISYLEDREPDLGNAPLTRLDGWLPQALRRAAAAASANS